MKVSGRFDVTREIIDLAMRKDSNHCMIADAIKAAMPEVRSISVDLQSIRYTDPASKKRVIYLTPEWCQFHLLKFDQGEEIEPWAFKLPSRPSQVTPTRQWTKKADGSERHLRGQGRRRQVNTGNGMVEVHGGTPPPVGILAGGDVTGRPGVKSRRRRFGVCMAGRVEAKVS